MIVVAEAGGNKKDLNPRLQTAAVICVCATRRSSFSSLPLPGAICKLLWIRFSSVTGSGYDALSVAASAFSADWLNAHFIDHLSVYRG